MRSTNRLLRAVFCPVALALLLCRGVLLAAPQVATLQVFILTEGAENAEVYIGGELNDIAPCALELEAGKPFVLELRHPLYRSIRRTFTLKPGEKLPVNFSMEIAHPGLKVTAPHGVAVTIFNTATGETRDLGSVGAEGEIVSQGQLLPGGYTLRFSMLGRQSRELPVDLRKSDTIPVVVAAPELPPQGALLNLLAVMPPPERVFIDGAAAAYNAEQQVVEAPAMQSFELRLERDGYAPRTLKIEKPLEPGEERMLDKVFLEASVGRLRLAVSNEAGGEVPAEFYIQCEALVDGRAGTPDKSPQVLVDIPKGRHSVSLRHPAYELGDDKEVEIAEGREVELAFVAKARKSELMLVLSFARPADAGAPELMVFPEPLAKADGVYRLEAGREYRIRVRNAGFHKNQEKIVPPLQPGERRVERIEMEFDFDAYRAWQEKETQARYQQELVQAQNALQSMDNRLRKVPDGRMASASGVDMRAELRALETKHAELIERTPPLKTRVEMIRALIARKEIQPVERK